MSKFKNFEIYLFIVLCAISLVAIAYYFYKAAYRFDPYYIYQEKLHEAKTE